MKMDAPVRTLHSRDKNESGRSLYRKAGTGVFQFIDAVLPHTPRCDAVIHILRFWRANGRLPRQSTDPNATFNDFVLERILTDGWTHMERRCIDKQQAKQVALSLCPAARVSETATVLPLTTSGDLRNAADTLLLRRGRQEVAKPTHSSGSVLFLRLTPDRNEVMAFCKKAARSYYRASRESQYRGLPRKIIIEQDLSCGADAPIDYKFFCSLGKVLFCQIDVDRFTDHRRRLVTPEFEPIDTRFAYDLPKAPPRKPNNFAEMLRIAEDLSRPFPFVRIDLYSIGDAVYFGEFTFAPEGGAGALSNEEFGISVMTEIRRQMVQKGAGQ